MVVDNGAAVDLFHVVSEVQEAPRLKIDYIKLPQKDSLKAVF